MQKAGMSVGEIMSEVRAQFKEAGISNAAFEAACLFERHTGIKRASLPAVKDRPGDFIPAAFFNDVRRRISGEPLQYILREWDFMGLRFSVGPGVLIPRPDTEILAETALDFIKPQMSPKVLELCFGSGCIGISLACMHSGCTVLGIDISEEALRYARYNISLHSLCGRVRAVKGDMLNSSGLQKPEKFDMLVCNPPYIPSCDIAGLDESVRGYEPLNALDGGPDGLIFYRAAGLWLRLIRKGGAALFEVGAGQSKSVAGILSAAGLCDISIKKDYAGIDRVVGGHLRQDAG